ncbi:MAG: hypothetical protein Q7S96_04085 [bacterium]|nr:hypothetical protein [bacterium]
MITNPSLTPSTADRGGETNKPSQSVAQTMRTSQTVKFGIGMLLSLGTRGAFPPASYSEALFPGVLVAVTLLPVYLLFLIGLLLVIAAIRPLEDKVKRKTRLITGGLYMLLSGGTPMFLLAGAGFMITGLKTKKV